MIATTPGLRRVTPQEAINADPLAGVLSPCSSEQEVLRACQLLMRPGEVHELRVPKASRERTISGYFDSAERMAEAALKVDGKYPGVYITTESLPA
jgi:hypothetical protein